VEPSSVRPFGVLLGRFEHLFVIPSHTDGIDDTFTHTGDDGFLFRTTDQAVEVRAHRHPSSGTQLNTVLRDAIGGGAAASAGVRTVNDLGKNAGLHGFEDVSPSQVDGGRLLKSQGDASAVGGDEGAHNVRYVATCQVMRLQLAGRYR